MSAAEPVEVQIARLRGWVDMHEITEGRRRGWWGQPPDSVSGRRCRVPSVRGHEGCALAIELLLEMVNASASGVGRAPGALLAALRPDSDVSAFVRSIVHAWLTWRGTGRAL